MRKAHIIGVCGMGMSGLAHLLQEEGYEVSGSDAHFYPPGSDYVARLGITTHQSYHGDHIPPEVELIVIGKNAQLTQENPEVARAFRDYPEGIQSLPEVLGRLTQTRRNLVVVGSYGKSTLSALLTWILLQAKKDPGYFIGAQTTQLEHPTELGGGELFVLEGDEYPSAHWDERSKFLHYQPSTVLLTSACHDHVNVFPTLTDYHRPFRELLTLLPPEGQLVACLDEEHARTFYEEHEGNKISYGFDPLAQWSCREEAYGRESRALLTHQGQEVVHISTTLLGRHNMQNIIAAAALLLGEKLVTPEEFAQGVANFQGLIRRLDPKVGEECSLEVYEGFGSSYQKARSAIEAMGLHFPGRRLSVVFEPHTFTWRNRSSLRQYHTAFEGVDTVWIYQPPTKGPPPTTSSPWKRSSRPPAVATLTYGPLLKRTGRKSLVIKPQGTSSSSSLRPTLTASKNPSSNSLRKATKIWKHHTTKS